MYKIISLLWISWENQRKTRNCMPVVLWLSLNGDAKLAQNYTVSSLQMENDQMKCETQRAFKHEDLTVFSCVHLFYYYVLVLMKVHLRALSLNFRYRMSWCRYHKSAGHIAGQKFNSIHSIYQIMGHILLKKDHCLAGLSMRNSLLLRGGLKMSKLG